jgi:hypothetical protein
MISSSSKAFYPFHSTTVLCISPNRSSLRCMASSWSRKPFWSFSSYNSRYFAIFSTSLSFNLLTCIHFCCRRMCVVVITKVGGTGSSTPSQLRTNLAFFLKIQRKQKEKQVESSLEGGNKGRGDLLSNGVSK